MLEQFGPLQVADKPINRKDGLLVNALNSWMGAGIKLADGDAVVCTFFFAHAKCVCADFYDCLPFDGGERRHTNGVPPEEAQRPHFSPSQSWGRQACQGSPGPPVRHGGQLHQVVQRRAEVEYVRAPERQQAVVALEAELAHGLRSQKMGQKKEQWPPKITPSHALNMHFIHACI